MKDDFWERFTASFFFGMGMWFVFGSYALPILAVLAVVYIIVQLIID